MTFGIKVYDADGNLTLDSDTLGGRVVVTENATGTSGSVSAPGLANGVPFAFIAGNASTVLPGSSFEANLPSPLGVDITLTGSGFTWTKPAAVANETSGSSVIYAGVF